MEYPGVAWGLASKLGSDVPGLGENGGKAGNY